MKVWMRTFGCRANQYDSEAVRAMVERAGHEMVESATAADVAVFNSCAVTAQAEADLRQAVRRASRENPRLVSTVMGCAAALPHAAGSARLDLLPSVAHVVGGADLAGVATALGLDADLGSAGIVRTRHHRAVRATLRIQDGCDEHCTFCATTIARGANRSRGATELIEEALQLAQHHPEIVLTGIHIGSYGRDHDGSLAELLDALVRAVPRVRFRLSSLEASEVDDRLAGLLTADPSRVAPYLHAPLQSGSDRLLRRMGRHWYTARSYTEAVERLVARTPVFGLGADLIAGFPGETEDDHAASLALIDRLPFSSLHVFPYSVRAGTAAERLGDHVPPPVIARRAREIREAAAAKAKVYAAARAGGTCDVILVGTDSSGEWDGLTEDYLSVTVRGGALARGDRIPCVLRLNGEGLVADPAARGPENFHR